MKFHPVTIFLYGQGFGLYGHICLACYQRVERKVKIEKARGYNRQGKYKFAALESNRRKYS